MAADDSKRGFDVDRFIPAPPPHLVCPICHGVLNNPKQPSACQHLFCSVCINDAISATNPGERNCPTCRTPFRDLVAPHLVIIQILNDLKLRCSLVENGCKAIPTVETVLKHEAACGFAPVQCPNQGCNSVGLLKNNLNQHTQQCGWRIVVCPNGCGSGDIKAKDLNTHLSNHCTNRIVQCTLGCGVTRLQAKDLDNHVSNLCKKRRAQCVVPGCRFEAEDGKADVWREHMADEGRLHLELVIKEMSKLRSENEAIKARLERVENANQELNRVVQEQDKRLRGLEPAQPGPSQVDSIELKHQLAKLQQMVTDSAVQNAHFSVCDVSSKWEAGIDETSEELKLLNQDPALRYPFKLQAFTTTWNNKKYLAVNFIPRRGEGNQQLRWPITNLIRLSVLNTKGRKNKTFVLQGEDVRHFFSQHNPPQQNNTDGWGWCLVDKSEIDSGDFVDGNGKLFIKAEMLPQVFITPPTRDVLVGIAKEKGCDWVVEGVQARWREGVGEFSPQLTLTHPNPSLQYSYLLLIHINLTHYNEGHVGVCFVPRVGAQTTMWPIRNHIKITVLSLSQAHTHKVNIINDSASKEWFTTLGTPPQHNFEGFGFLKFLSEEEVFGGAYVDSNDRMFLKVEVLDSTFD